MARQGWVGRGLLFVRALDELCAADPDGEVTVTEVADSIDMDERESANVMAWLIERDLVREAGRPDWEVPDAFTTAPLELTDLGRTFSETGEPPAVRGLDGQEGLDQLREYL